MSTSLPSEYTCSDHPDRRAQGLCMLCSKVICNECSTKIDGVNHCISCYARRSARPHVPRHAGLQRVLASVVNLGLLAIVVELVRAFGSLRS